MKNNIWYLRATKYLNKAAWTASSMFRSKPSITTIHHDMSKNMTDRMGEFVKKCDSYAYIEPVFGHLISETGYWIEEASQSNYANRRPTWHEQTPQFLHSLNGEYERKKSSQEFDAVILLQHPWEWNYYHFYIDVLSKLHLFKKVGIPLDIPIVIGRYAMELPFAEQLIQQGELKNLNWIIQDRQFIKAKNIYYARTFQPYGKRADFLMKAILPQDSRPRANRRIYLSRQKQGSRKVLNFEEITPILQKHQFEVVYPESMSIPEQIDLFKNTRYLMGPELPM